MQRQDLARAPPADALEQVVQASKQIGVCGIAASAVSMTALDMYLQMNFGSSTPNLNPNTLSIQLSDSGAAV